MGLNGEIIEFSCAGEQTESPVIFIKKTSTGILTENITTGPLKCSGTKGYKNEKKAAKIFKMLSHLHGVY